MIKEALAHNPQPRGIDVLLEMIRRVDDVAFALDDFVEGLPDGVSDETEVGRVAATARELERQLWSLAQTLGISRYETWKVLPYIS